MTTHTRTPTLLRRFMAPGMATAGLLACVLLSTAPLAAQGDMPLEMTVDELSREAYRQGLAEKNLIVRRGIEQLEEGRPAQAAAFFRRASVQIRRQLDQAISKDMARDLKLAANDLVWMADELAGGRAPQSEVLLSTVAMVSHTLARHHRDAARQAFSDRTYDRAGSHLEAAAVNTDAALAFGGVSAQLDAVSLEEARQVATRLATGGRGGKLKDRFGSAIAGLSGAIMRAEANAVWPMRRVVGQLVRYDAAAGRIVIESPGEGGPEFRIASDGVVVGRDGVVPYDELTDAEVVAVWYRAATPKIAARVIIPE